MIQFNFFLDKCQCSGVADKYGRGSECRYHGNIITEYLDGFWCYADTENCSEARKHQTFSTSIYEGRYGPSRQACLDIDGMSLIIKESYLEQ